MLTKQDALTLGLILCSKSIIDLLDSDDELAEEQEVFDTQDEEVTQLALRLERLISSSDTGQSRVAFNRLKRIEKGLNSVLNNIPEAPAEDDDVGLLQQLEEQLSGLKKEFADVHNSLLSLDI